MTAHRNLSKNQESNAQMNKELIDNNVTTITPLGSTVLPVAIDHEKTQTLPEHNSTIQQYPYQNGRQQMKTPNLPTKPPKTKSHQQS